MIKYRKGLVLLMGTALAVSALNGCGKKHTTEEQVTIIKEGQMEASLVSFAGRTLVVEEADKEFTFDVSQATINTPNMRTGDDLIIYYEGTLEGTDTSDTVVKTVEDRGNPKKEAKEQTAVGTLVDITENTITIRQNDGTELTFSSNNCKHEFKNGIREGNWIVVTYVGEIKGTDTTNITVVKITDNDPNTVKEEHEKMKIKAVDEKVYATAGVHIRASYTTDSKVLGSLKLGESIQRTGICENGWSRVKYNDKDAYIYGDYLTTKAPAADAKPAKTNGEKPATPQQGNAPQPVQQPEATTQPEETSKPEEPAQTEEPAQPEEKTVEGTVKDVSMNTLTISVGDGQKEYTLSIIDAVHEYANGIQVGNTVKVTYTGDLEQIDSVIVSKVQDSDPNTAAQEAKYTGEIVDGTQNTITITTDDGLVMTFIKEGAQDNTEGDLVGTRITITADMTEADMTDNIYQAKQIDIAE